LDANIPHTASATSRTDFVSTSGKNIADHTISTPQLRCMIRRLPVRSERIAKTTIEIANKTAAAVP
jgi:hypothetical protein